jgi:hypothetical protein
MPIREVDRAPQVAYIEQHADLIHGHQIDLIGQIEWLLRAVRHTMELVEPLRSLPHRVVEELPNGEKEKVLERLAEELKGLDSLLLQQHDTGAAMLAITRQMMYRVRALLQASHVEQVLAEKERRHDG